MYYEKAAKKGNQGAIFQLGFFYENGLGVKKDINKALELYKKSDTQEGKERIKLLNK